MSTPDTGPPSEKRRGGPLREGRHHEELFTGLFLCPIQADGKNRARCLRP